MQLSFNKRTSRQPQRGRRPAAMCDLREGEQAVLDRIELDADEAQRLMELGFLPGACVAAARCAPGGDPRVYRVDGSEFAMRRETASRLKLRQQDVL
ncbi:MAG: FeoA family protein [Bryobacteraceae bacterium]